MTTQREEFGSRIGFILAAAGSAVGIGNLVGFPVKAAQNGGGAFLLIYALFVFFICMPVMYAEMALGRHTRKDPLGAYNKISGRDGKWRIAGILSIITPFMIAVFYTVITVWIFGYLVQALMGNLDKLAEPETFGSFLTDNSLFGYMVGVALIVMAILAGGVKGGIERAAKVMMPALLVMLIGMVIYVLTLDNAMAGVRYYLIPDFSKISVKVISDALSQAFFSLSLGMGILITYGSYLSKKDNIPSSAKFVAITDTFVAFSAGLMILPAIFSIYPDTVGAELSGSSITMIFSFLPKIFLAMQVSIGYFGASIVAVIFFLLVFFAAITSLVSIIEVPVASVMDEKGYSRKKSLQVMVIALGVFSVLATMSFGMVDWLTNFVEYSGKDQSFFQVIYDVFYDTILPLNGLLVCLFVMFRWKKANLNKALAEGNEGYEGSWLEKYVDVALSTFVPVILVVIFSLTVMRIFFDYNPF
ncbi:MAG: sodium-dependent transporter [Algicola sp.]|nr:sodium-dependent transporter [Algicola sp.]